MDQILEALNHRWRREMLKMIWEAGERGLSPKELAAQSDFTLSDAGYHTRRMLGDDKVLVVARKQQIRGSVQKFYRIASEVTDVRWFREIVGLPLEGR